MADYMTDKDYSENGGNRCPVCRSDKVESGNIEADGAAAWSNCSCGECGAEWVDIYSLVGYTELVDPADLKEANSG